jgi:hypothetical protein
MGLAFGDTWWEEDGDIFRTGGSRSLLEAKVLVSKNKNSVIPD